MSSLKTSNSSFLDTFPSLSASTFSMNFLTSASLTFCPCPAQIFSSSGRISEASRVWFLSRSYWWNRASTISFSLLLADIGQKNQQIIGDEENRQRMKGIFFESKTGSDNLICVQEELYKDLQEMKNGTQKPRLSVRLKHPQMIVENDTVRKRDYVSRWTSVLGNQPLKEQGSPHKWQFKILQHGSLQQCYGMCLESSAAKANFMDTQTWTANPNHGQYIITSDQLYFSHMRQRSTEVKGIAVLKGDIVSIEYNLAQAKIFFSCRDAKLQLDVVPAPEGDCYRPCVYIHNRIDLIQWYDPQSKSSKQEENIVSKGQ